MHTGQGHTGARQNSTLSFAAAKAGEAVLIYLAANLILVNGSQFLLGVAAKSGADMSSYAASVATLFLNGAMSLINTLLPLYFLRGAAKGAFIHKDEFRPRLNKRQLSALYLVFLGIYIGAVLLGGLVVSLFGGGQALGAAPAIPQGFLPAILYFVFTVLILPFFEETLFRSYIMRLFAGHGAWLAIIVTSLLFALLHIKTLGVVPALTTSLLLGYAAYAGASIKTSYAMHASANAYAFVALYAKSTMNSVSALALVSALSGIFMALGIMGALLFYSLKPQPLPKHAQSLSSRLKTVVLNPPFALCLIACALYALFIKV